ncbi:hypothetical protein JTB14_013845 [Gonioctena quinquepunctata]|nr:hypothetical protein JTB14_013845 [Gonioctena quinquepunctata]
MKPQWLLNMLNELLRRQKFPDYRKIAKFILIFEYEKPPELQSSNGPISSLNAISKLYEAKIRKKINIELRMEKCCIKICLDSAKRKIWQKKPQSYGAYC